jgi:hypothetical protein
MSVRFLNAIQTTIASSLIKTDSNGIIVSAVAGTDYVIPSGSITGNAGSATVLQNARTLTIGNTGKSFNGSSNVSWTLAEIGAYDATNPSGFITSSGSTTGTSGGLLREDNRTISPSELTAGWLKFGFTSWNNNNTNPYADFLHLRSYTDASGGSDNLVMFLKSGIGMRIWQQAWGNSGAYSTYKDVAFTDSNITGNAATATTLQTARTLTIGNTGKTFNGGANVSWTLAEIGAYAATNPSGFITATALNGYATESYVDNALAALVDTAPDALNTLNELATALGDDPNFATTVSTNIGTKVSKSGDTMTGSLTAPSFIGKLMGGATGAPDSTIWCVSGQYTDWGIFYNEGTPDTIEFKANGAVTASIALDNGNITTSGTLSASGYNKSNWDTAFGWGNHAGLYLPLSGGTLTGLVIFPSAATTKPVLPNGFISRNDLEDTTGRHDIWGISQRYYPSNSTAADAWGIQWSGTPNDIVFVGAGTDRVTISLDEGNITSLGTVTAPTFSGALSGNATTATTLATARTLTIGNTGKSFNGSANVSWSLAEIGAQPAGSYLTAESDTLATVTGRGSTTSAVLYSTRNTSSGRSNLSFDIAKTVVGNIHIQNGAGPANNSSNQAAITFQGDTASQSQAGIYVLNNNGYGTSMGFAVTESYSTGPQIFMTATNNGVVNFTRQRPTVGGNGIWHNGDFTSTNISNWNAAYGWGNHADVPYWNVSLTDPVQVESTDVTFQGNVTINGTLTENSSIRYKENIKSIGDALLRVNKLNPVTYNKIGVVREEIGLIAEDVFELFPEVVTLNDANQPDGIQYQRLSVILLKALQELTERVNKLENK